jgi:hypothetical protein
MGELDSWQEALLAGRFAALTSAGILFSNACGGSRHESQWTG